MAVEATITVEIAEVGGNGLGIAGIVAENRQRNHAVAPGFLEFPGGGIGNVNRPLIISPEVLRHLFLTHKDLGTLARSIEMQKGPSLFFGILNLQVRSIPSRALIIAHVGVDRVTAVETMGKGYRNPCHVVGGLVTTPDLPSTAQGSLIKFPT